MTVQEIEIDIDYNKLQFFVLNEIVPLFESPKTLSYQIALQCRADCPEELELEESCGSLVYDWDDYCVEVHDKPPLKKNVFKQEVFTQTPSFFKGTVIEQINHQLRQKYDAVRGRLMLLPQKSTLTYHVDESERLHVPVYTSPDAFIIIEDTVHRLSWGKSYLVDTTKRHTAVNTSLNYRVHLVYCLPPTRSQNSNWRRDTPDTQAETS